MCEPLGSTPLSLEITGDPYSESHARPNGELALTPLDVLAQDEPAAFADTVDYR
jgi:hypothetical protein